MFQSVAVKLKAFADKPERATPEDKGQFSGEFFLIWDASERK